MARRFKTIVHCERHCMRWLVSRDAIELMVMLDNVADMLGSLASMLGKMTGYIATCGDDDPAKPKTPAIIDIVNDIMVTAETVLNEAIDLLRELAVECSCAVIEPPPESIIDMKMEIVRIRKLLGRAKRMTVCHGLATIANLAVLAYRILDVVANTMLRPTITLRHHNLVLGHYDILMKSDEVKAIVEKLMRRSKIDEEKHIN